MGNAKVGKCEPTRLHHRQNAFHKATAHRAVTTKTARDLLGRQQLFEVRRTARLRAAGQVRLGVTRVSCLDQKADLLDGRRTVLENFRLWNPGLSETICRLTLARFLCRTDDVHRLSGGQRLRAALACVLTGVNPPELLVLDEPTNHLDLASLANLEQTLRLYTGALLVVSHDRIFLNNIGVTRSVTLEGGAGGS